ncbi:MAG: response regulator [Chloroflexi bacterium]|nr:response regulator [Chloroflexota bacterium]
MTMQRTLSFLVVEDDTLSRQFIVNQLKDLGHQVVGQASNGLEALELTKRLSPDVVLTDLQMPDPETGRDDPQAGVKAARAIQKQCPTPVVALTAYEDPDLIREATSVGIGAYLLKPPQAQEIERAATIALARFDDMMALRDALAELRAAQDQLLEQERLAAVGQLSAGIAHEFNNILAAIILTAQMGLREPDLSPELVDDFGIIVAESRRAADLTQQMLDFGRRSMMRTEALDLAALVEQAAGELQQSLPQNACLILEIEATTRAAFTVEADPTQIRQALVNLADNAGDAMPEGGELRIRVERVCDPVPSSAPFDKVRTGFGAGSPVKREEKGGNWICLTVSDTGVGMTEDVRAHLFEPFFSTRSPQRSGLGLAQVYGIVKQHDGQIDVETEAGAGSTFRIYLPTKGGLDDLNMLDGYGPFEKGLVEKREREIEAKRLTVPSQEEGETILLVEDNEGLRAVGQAVLELLGYRVLTASNGIEALEVHEAEGGADLLITDLMMPRMGGEELVQELGKIDPRLKALAITGYSVQELPGELRRAGFLGVVQKPFDVDILAQVVRRALDAD